jgi:AsnC-type helix-turn-helix domain
VRRWPPTTAPPGSSGILRDQAPAPLDGWDHVDAVKLDEVDIKLLTALQADADRTNVELARLVGLSPAATLHRVRALKESGVIRIIRADVDPAAAGFPLRVFVTAALAETKPLSPLPLGVIGTTGSGARRR